MQASLFLHKYSKTLAFIENIIATRLHALKKRNGLMFTFNKNNKNNNF